MLAQMIHSTTIDERKGVPAISQLTWVWALVFTFFTSGLFALGMALHISYWVRSKRKTGVAFFLYLLFALIVALGFIPDRFIHQSALWGGFSTVASFVIGILWFGGAFELRRELMLYYATPEGAVLEINPWWTAVFTVYYLNYCLWVVKDSA